MWVLGLSKNLFHTLHNITTVVGILHRGNGCEWVFYAHFIEMYIKIGNKDVCGGYGWCVNITPG